jgi:hypothetical protein
MEMKRKSSGKSDPLESKNMNKVVNQLISEEASESIRHFDGRITKNERKFTRIELAEETFQKFLFDIIEYTVTEGLIEQERINILFRRT